VVREFQQEYFTRVALVLDTDLGEGEPQRLEAAISLAAGIVAHLSRAEALVDLWVAGDAAPITIGRSVGAFEQALDRLACVRAGAPFRADALLARLGPQLARLSCVVLVALRWDAERAQLQGRVRALGTGARAIALGEGTDSDAGPCWVSAAAVARGDALVL
jgi:uncharacterized protein (DUF58 family)